MALNHDRLAELLETPYYDIRTCMWYSSTEEAAEPTMNYLNDVPEGYFVANSLGRIEWQRLTQMPTAPGSPSLVASPYTTRMRPMTDMSFLQAATRIVVVSLSFRAYDDRLNGSAEQDAATNAAIEASLATNQAYMTSRFRGGLIGDWANNWFRPAFYIGGLNILRDLSQPQVGTRDRNGNLTDYNVSDLSVGLPLPWSFDDLYAVIDSNKGQSVNSIPQAYAQCVQYIDATGRFVRYPVKCVAQLVVSAKTGDR